MVLFVLEHAPLVSLVLPYLAWTDVESLSSVSRNLSTSLVRDSYFSHALVVVPSATAHRASAMAVRMTLARLSPLARRVAIANHRHVAFLHRLPLLTVVRIAKPKIRSDDDDETEPIRLTPDEILSLWCLTSVKHLELDAFVDDLVSLFRDMGRLETLDVVIRSRMANLQILTHLESLRTLRVRGAFVDDIDALGHLTFLTSLHLRSWSVHDITAIGRLVHLHALDLSRCNVVDLTPLATLRRLAHLRLEETPVTDLSPLSRLGRLQSLSLARSQASELTSLGACQATLQELDLSGCTLSHVHALGHLKSLVSLRLHHTTWPRLTTEPTLDAVLQRLSSLRTLDARVVVVALHPQLDFVTLQRLRSLEHLELTGDAVAGRLSLLALPQLVSLRLEWTYARAAAIPLAAVVHPRLRVLELVRLRLGGLQNLAFAPQLRTLRLIDVFLEDLTGVAVARHLVHYEHTCPMVHSHFVEPDEAPHAKAPTHDLTPLASLPNLTHVDLSFTSIRSIAPLQFLAQLRVVDLSCTDVVDVAPLASLTRLECLRLRETEITRMDGGAFGPHLRELVLPAHVDCRAIRAAAPRLKRLLHPDRDCRWSGHTGPRGFASTADHEGVDDSSVCAQS